MRESEIQKIIVKFLNKEANLFELEKLDTWLKKEKNSSLFNRFVKVEYLTALNMNEYDLSKAKIIINKKIKDTQRKRKIQVYKRLSIAATVLLIFGISYFQFINLEPKEETVIISKTIEAGSDKAILTFDNGDQVSLEKGKEFEKGNLVSNGEELLYNQKENHTNKKIKYNYLTIPRGGQFSIVLVDGTEVWLNSESKIKYPTTFNKGEKRKVELVYGEAYFEVSPSTQHYGATFNVIINNQNIEVLGTEFNIKAYKSEQDIATTLIGGEIVIEKGTTKKVLKPNQQSIINRNSDVIKVIEIDALEEVSWINGLFAFNEVSLEDMMKSISRWYDAQVIFEQAKHKQFVFTGVLERSKTINELLKIVEATSEGEISFEINDKTITIK